MPVTLAGKQIFNNQFSAASSKVATAGKKVHYSARYSTFPLGGQKIDNFLLSLD